jgi:hypothetical protein
MNFRFLERMREREENERKKERKKERQKGHHKLTIYIVLFGFWIVCSFFLIFLF